MLTTSHFTVGSVLEQQAEEADEGEGPGLNRAKAFEEGLAVIVENITVRAGPMGRSDRSRMAAAYGTASEVVALLHEADDVDALFDGCSALWRAVFAMNCENVDLLLAAGADPTPPMMSGCSPERLSRVIQGASRVRVARWPKAASPLFY